MKRRGKVAVLSLGCPRNLVDSEYILGRLKQKGYRVAEMEDADIGIVNTCAFIEDAKKESIDAILEMIELKKDGRLKKILVYGCLAQRYKQALQEELPEIDALVGRVSINHDRTRFALTPPHYAYLKICEGCVHACSYCVIPAIKGKFTSVPVHAVLERVSAFKAQGIQELNIIGQDITAYGADRKGVSLAGLLKKICAQRGIPWLRLLYLHPARVDDALLEVIAQEPRICKYIDLPIQHINDRILSRMHRRTSRGTIAGLIEKIRKTIPGAALRTSVIVGFPSETDAEFEELLEFIRETRFERLGVFMYSREEGTPAYDFTPQVPDRIARQRFQRIMQAQQEISRANNRALFGTTMEVLIEEAQEGYYLGRSRYDAPEVDGLVYVHSRKKLKTGELAQVRITDTLEYDLVGETA